jgi:GxxExxY protein
VHRIAGDRAAVRTGESIPIYYREQLVCEHRLDLLIAAQVILEVKAVDRLCPIHHAQLLSYLRASRKRIGLLANFNAPILPQGLKRLIL